MNRNRRSDHVLKVIILYVKSGISGYQIRSLINVKSLLIDLRSILYINVLKSNISPIDVKISLINVLISSRDCNLLGRLLVKIKISDLSISNIYVLNRRSSDLLILFRDSIQSSKVGILSSCICLTCIVKRIFSQKEVWGEVSSLIVVDVNILEIYRDRLYLSQLDQRDSVDLDVIFSFDVLLDHQWDLGLGKGSLGDVKADKTRKLDSFKLLSSLLLRGQGLGGRGLLVGDLPRLVYDLSCLREPFEFEGVILYVSIGS